MPAVTRACDGAGVALASGLLPLLLLRGVWRRFSTASHRGYAARASCRWARRWVPGRVRGHRPLGGWGHRVDGRLPSRQCDGYEYRQTKRCCEAGPRQSGTARTRCAHEAWERSSHIVPRPRATALAWVGLGWTWQSVVVRGWAAAARAVSQRGSLLLGLRGLRAPRYAQARGRQPARSCPEQLVPRRRCPRATATERIGRPGSGVALRILALTAEWSAEP